MKTRIFVDTNVFIYRFDQSAPAKKAKAVEILSQLESSGTGVVSTQIMEEFYSIATGKVGIPANLALSAISAMDVFEIVTVSPSLVVQAAELTQRKSLSLWDALVVTAAKFAKCSVLLSEDLNHGELIDGVRIENPFQ